jgi:mannose-6-phosphate isomerase class I
LARETTDAKVEVLAACRYFAAESIAVDGVYSRTTRNDSFHIVLAKTDGVGVISQGDQRALSRGEAVLIPGLVDRFSLEGTGSVLEYYVPDIRQDVVTPLSEAGHAMDDIVRLGGDPYHSDLRS